MSDLVEDWCNQIEKIVKESDQARKEKDIDLGPNSELDYWRSRQAKINGMHKQLASKEGKVCFPVSGIIEANSIVDCYLRFARRKIKSTEAMAASR